MLGIYQIQSNDQKDYPDKKTKRNAPQDPGQKKPNAHCNQNQSP